MNAQSRHEAIVALCQAHGYVSVDTLASRFQVTPQTIRRDINTLCDAHRLRRRHGGVELIPHLINLPYDARRIHRFDGKRRIAEAVARRVPHGASLLFGIGTTPVQVAQALAGHENLTVVTNNLHVALTFADNPTAHVVIAGGSLRKGNPEVLGTQSDTLFRGYRADFGIYGVGGVDADGTLLDFDRAEAASRAALRESCRTRVLVADVTKFGRQAPVRGGHLSEADWLVLDAALSEYYLACLSARTEVVIATGVENMDTRGVP